MEDEIKAFIVEKYWEINGDFGRGFNFSLNRIDETKVSKIFDFEVVQKLKKELVKKLLK